MVLMQSTLSLKFRKWTFGLPLVAVFLAGPAYAQSANPQETNPQEGRKVESPRDPRVAYPVELEPHVSFGASDFHHSVGFGAGLRLGVPIARGYLGRAPQNIALGVGGDFLHFDNCYYGANCDNAYVANYIFVPATVQWNVAVARPLTLFLEGGAFFYKGWVDHCAPNTAECNTPDPGVLPTVAVGGRVHVTDDIALTLRLGYPTSTIGVSFM
jgi:hypothetical protein